MSWQSMVTAVGLGQDLGAMMPVWQGWHCGRAGGWGRPTAGGARTSTWSATFGEGDREQVATWARSRD